MLTTESPCQPSTACVSITLTTEISHTGLNMDMKLYTKLYVPQMMSLNNFDDTQASCKALEKI